jgi:hypothetical protein
LSAERLPVSTRLRVKSLAISSRVCVIWFHPFDLKCDYHVFGWITQSSLF